MCCLISNSSLQLESKPLIFTLIHDEKAKVRNSAFELICLLISKNPRIWPLIEKAVGIDYSFRI